MARTGLRFNAGDSPNHYDNHAEAAAYQGVVVADYPAKLHNMTVTHIFGSTIYLMLFDAAAIPNNGAVPKVVLACPTASSSSYDQSAGAPANGKLFTTGIVWAMSSTPITLTKATTATVFAEANWE